MQSLQARVWVKFGFSMISDARTVHKKPGKNAARPTGYMPTQGEPLEKNLTAATGMSPKIHIGSGMGTTELLCHQA